MLHVCADSSVKESVMAGHIMMKDEDEKWEKTHATSINNWNKNTAHAAETATICKVIMMIKENDCEKRHRTMYCMSDNKRLINVLTQSQMKSNEFTHDAGGIIERIVDLRKNLRTKLEFMHCKGNIQKPDEFEDNPITYVINLYNEKSKEVRKEVARINGCKDI